MVEDVISDDRYSKNRTSSFVDNTMEAKIVVKVAPMVRSQSGFDASY